MENSLHRHLHSMPLWTTYWFYANNLRVYLGTWEPGGILASPPHGRLTRGYISDVYKWVSLFFPSKVLVRDSRKFFVLKICKLLAQLCFILFKNPEQLNITGNLMLEQHNIGIWLEGAFKQLYQLDMITVHNFYCFTLVRRREMW